MSFRKTLVYIALGTIAAWILSVTVHVLRGNGIRTGRVPEWLLPTAPLPVSADALMIIGLCLSWFGSIGLWASFPRRGAGHWLLLPPLVVLGMLIGPIYILLCGTSIWRRPADENPRGSKL